MLELMKCSAIEPSSGRKRRASERGFTLVEMMVVVAMIAMIVGISIPNLWRSSVRAEMTGHVEMVQQAVAVARIYAIKNSSQVALQLLPSNTQVAKYSIHAWVDANANGALDNGEEEVGSWPMAGETTIGPQFSPPDGDSSVDSNYSLTPLAGTAKGVIFFANGTAVVHDGQIGTGQGAVVLKDIYENLLRIRIQGGSGSVLVDMWNYEVDKWQANPKNLWRY
jgi:prepilin-type N-terminal cleavage/methylation domain-containing protein